MAARDEKDLTKVIESLPEDIFNLIDLDGKDYWLLAFEDDKVSKDFRGDTSNWQCAKLKGAKKCLSGLNDQGRVNTTFKFNVRVSEGVYLDFCEKCTKADLLLQLLQSIQQARKNN